jgi:hypothetical protein
MDTAEYERRKEFCTAMKGMSQSEFIEIARILRRNNIQLSENRSGFFFDISRIPQEVFEQLLQFREFVEQNNRELAERDTIRLGVAYKNSEFQEPTQTHR